MKILLLIGTGSFLGGIFRYLLSHFIHIRIPSTFPFGTLTVNIIGCFLVGIIIGLLDKGNITHEWRLFLMTGLLGGFTTFSAFSGETVGLFRNGQLGYAVVYVLTSVMIGLLATYIGYVMTKIF